MAPKKRPASSTTMKAPPMNSQFEPEKELEIEEVTTKEEEKTRDEDCLKVLELYLEKTDKEMFPDGFAKIQDEIDRVKELLEPKDTEASETEEKEQKKNETPKAAAKPAAKNKVTKPKPKPKAKTAAKNKRTKQKENQEKEKNNEEEEGKKRKNQRKDSSAGGDCRMGWRA